MTLERPDLSDVAADVLAYIESLEMELVRVGSLRQGIVRGDSMLEPSEPPTTINLITVSANGVTKRTPRHLYVRQRRGGMGVFDLDSDVGDPPAFLFTADESDAIVVVTDQARAFRLPLSQLPEGDVRVWGAALSEYLSLLPDERPAVVMPDRGGTHAVLVSQRGQVRRISGHYFGESLKPGTVLHDLAEGGPPAAACWSSGNQDLFLATRLGRAIRFAERQVPVRGCLGMRVSPDDLVVGVAALSPDDGVFLLNREGKGTIRLMSGFSANKSPGSGGKVAMKTDDLIGVAAANVSDGGNDDIFVISHLGKIIRFQADEVPPKEGVVQGVNCMSLRADACVALTSTAVAR